MIEESNFSAATGIYLYEIWSSNGSDCKEYDMGYEAM
jgi:hypothetical protein